MHVIIMMLVIFSYRLELWFTSYWRIYIYVYPCLSCVSVCVTAESTIGIVHLSQWLWCHGAVVVNNFFTGEFVMINQKWIHEHFIFHFSVRLKWHPIAFIIMAIGNCGTQGREPLRIVIWKLQWVREVIIQWLKVRLKEWQVCFWLNIYLN